MTSESDPVRTGSGSRHRCGPARLFAERTRLFVSLGVSRPTRSSVCLLWAPLPCANTE